MTATKRTTRFRVDGMDCASCAVKIETAARRTAGVQGVSVSVASGTMAVAHEDAADLDAENEDYRTASVIPSPR